MFMLAAFCVCVEAGAQKVAVSTDVVSYLNLGTMNIEASYALAQHWSVTAGAKYNPFVYGKEDAVLQSKQRVYALGTRYWPWHIYSGWWLAGKVQYQEFSRGSSSSAYTAEGDRIGSGISGGYTYMLHPHWNVEVGVGVWAGYEDYVHYACPRCGRTVEQGTRLFVLPNDLILTLAYIF